jgi:hypothetical protein
VPFRLPDLRTSAGRLVFPMVQASKNLPHPGQTKV